jgi:hypothetical protein
MTTTSISGKDEARPDSSDYREFRQVQISRNDGSGAEMTIALPT